MKRTLASQAAAKGQEATELETPGEVNTDQLALLADICTTRGFNVDGQALGSSITSDRVTPVQCHDSSARTTYDNQSHKNSPDASVQNCSALIAMETHEQVAVESPLAEQKRTSKKRKIRPDEARVGPTSTEIRRTHPTLYRERSHDDRNSAGSSTRLNADRHASAFEARSTLGQFQQSTLPSALNTTGMPRDPVSILRSEREMLTAYATAIVGPEHSMQPFNLAAALGQEEAARVAAGALQILTENSAAGLVPVQFTSQRPAITPPQGAYGGVPLSSSPMLTMQGFPVTPALLLQQQFNPAINYLQLHHTYQQLLTMNPSLLQVASTCGPRLPHSASPRHFSGLGAGPVFPSGADARHAFAADRDVSIPAYGASSLPVVLFMSDDETKLSSYQILLRQQIEAFVASEDDVTSHARGRNKPITLGQVGIRCRHCSHTTWNRREKGSAYFPHTLKGLYQAAQNMGSSHFNDPMCLKMPAEIQKQFTVTIACKSNVGSGKHYWAESARKLGLVDTDRGIRTIFDVLNGVL